MRSVRFIVFDGLLEIWLFAASGFCVSFCMVRVFGEVCRRGDQRFLGGCVALNWGHGWKDRS